MLENTILWIIGAVAFLLAVYSVAKVPEEMNQSNTAQAESAVVDNAKSLAR